MQLISYCCRPTLTAKVAGPLLSRITWALLKLLVLSSNGECWFNTRPFHYQATTQGQSFANTHTRAFAVTNRYKCRY